MVFGAGLRVVAKTRLQFAGVCFSCCQAAAHKHAGKKTRGNGKLLKSLHFLVTSFI